MKQIIVIATEGIAWIEGTGKKG